MAGFWDTLALGQIYMPLVLAGASAWLLLERGEGAWAGFLMGLVVAMKPNFLVWPVLLLLSGHRLPALVSVATAAAISAIPLIVFGPEVYRQWLELIASDVDRAAFLTNASLAGLTARIGHGTVGLVALACLLRQPSGRSGAGRRRCGLALWRWSCPSSPLPSHGYTTRCSCSR